MSLGSKNTPQSKKRVLSINDKARIRALVEAETTSETKARAKKILANFYGVSLITIANITNWKQKGESKLVLERVKKRVHSHLTEISKDKK